MTTTHADETSFRVTAEIETYEDEKSTRKTGEIRPMNRQQQLMNHLALLGSAIASGDEAQMEAASAEVYRLEKSYAK